MRTTRVWAAMFLCSIPAPGHVVAQVTISRDERVLPRGVVIERVPCGSAPGQSYALYLPSAFANDRRWPILYAFDPGAQGSRPVRLAVEAAERFGWIVAGSNNSRNGPMAEIQAAVNTLLQDTDARFPIDARRVYATGFSGGARVATGLALACRGCVAGVFAQGAGLPAGMSRAPVLDFAWFATAGERDMNYAELFELEQELQKRNARQRLRSFAGGHEWAPPALWAEALEWFELLAMHDGRRPPDAALASSLFERASTRLGAFQAEGMLLDERRELAAIVRDFDGLADTSHARRRLGELEASSSYKKARERERDHIAEQARVTSDLQGDLAQLAQAQGDEHGQLLLRATRDATGLVRGLTGVKEPASRLVYERALSQVFIQAMEAARDALRRGQTDSARELFEIAATLRPEAPSPHLGRAQAMAMAGRKQEPVQDLRRALELGLAPAELASLLESNDAFAKLRDDPDVRVLLNGPRQP